MRLCPGSNAAPLTNNASARQIYYIQGRAPTAAVPDVSILSGRAAFSPDDLVEPYHASVWART